jgi:cytochrome c553
MRRVLKYLSYLVLALIVVLGAAIAYAYVSTNSRVARTWQVNSPPVTIPVNDPEAVERGRYLVHKVSLCIECHGEDLGGKQVTEFPVKTLWGSNLTRGRGGLGASYTDADFTRALTHGVKKDGRSVVFMPSQDYKFTERDMASLIAYIRSLPPVDRETPGTELGFLARALSTFVGLPLLPAELIDHENVGFEPDTARADAVSAGDYVIDTAGCRGCHGPALDGVGGMPDAANLTPVGIGHWTEADFKTAIREARRPNGTTILPTMPRVYKEVPDDELSRIYAYLRTLKPSGEKSKTQG